MDTEKSYKVTKDNILYKCQWSPFEGHAFSSSIQTTIVNGVIAYNDGKLTDSIPGKSWILIARETNENCLLYWRSVYHP